MLLLKRERIPTYSISKRICFYSKVNAFPHTQSANEFASTQKLTHLHILNQQTNLLLLKRERIPTYSISKRICFYSKVNAFPHTQSANEFASTQKGTHPHILHQQTNLLLLKRERLPTYSISKRICFYSKVNASPHTPSANVFASTQKLTHPHILNQQTNLLLLKRERIPTYSISKRNCITSEGNANPQSQTVNVFASTQKLTHPHILN